MNVEYYGTMIIISIGADEPRDSVVNITLPDGYSYEKLFIVTLSGIGFLHPFNKISNAHYTFPPVNSHSPNTISLYPDTSGQVYISLIIEKFGQIPDTNYFKRDNIFEPILVTGDDGKEYNVILSDQFK